MASPIGHTLTGLAIGRLAQPRDFRDTVSWLAFAVVVSNAPDLDFIAGIAGGGGINSVHRGPSHSILAGVVFSFAVAFGLGHFWKHRQRLFWTSLTLYGSHLFLDMCTHTGIPLLWPFSSELYSLPVSILVGIDHGTPASTVDHFVWSIASLRNLGPLLLELLLFVPLFLIVVRLRGSGLPREPDSQNTLSRKGPPPEPDNTESPRAVNQGSPGKVEHESNPKDDMNLEQLRDQVNLLQRQAKWTQIALLAAIALIPLIVILVRNFYGSSISAEQFVLHDAAGTPRAALVLNEGVEPYLIFFGNEGEDRAVIGVDRDGKPLMGLLDKDEVTRAAIRLDQDDLPILSLIGHDSRNIVLQIDNDGLGKLVFTNDKDAPKVIYP